MKKTVLLIIISAFIAFNCQLTAQISDSTLKWKELMDSTELYYSKSDFKTGLKFGYKSLTQCEKEFGVKDTNYYKTMYKIYRIYSEFANYDSTIYYLKKILVLLKEIKGENNADYALCLNNVGTHYGYKGLYKESEKCLLKALSIRKNLLGEDDPYYAVSLNDLGTLYRNIGKYNLADSLLKKALIIFKDTGQDFAYGFCAGNLAEVYRQLRIYKESERLYDISAKMIYKTRGDSSLDYAFALNNLGAIYHDVGKSNETLPLYLKSKEIFHKLIGDDNDRYATLLLNIGGIYQYLGNYKEAYNSFMQANNILNKISSTNPKAYLELLNYIALSQFNLMEFDSAKATWSEIHELGTKFYGEYNLFYANAMNLYSKLLIYMGNFSEAEVVVFELSNIYKNFIINLLPYLADKEKEQFYTRFDNIYNLLMSIAIEKKSIDTNFLLKTYDNILLTKSVLLNSSIKLRKSIERSNDSAIVELFEQYKKDRIILSKQYSLSKESQNKPGFDIDSLERTVNEKERTLSKKILINVKESIGNKLYSTEDVASNLKNDEAAIEIIRFNKLGRIPENYKDTSTIFDLKSNVNYAALILKHSSDDSFKSIDLILLTNGNDLEEKYFAKYSKMIKDLGDEYKSGSKMWTNDYIKDLLKDMYVNFWQKIQEKLVGIKTVYLSVDGVYNKINLNTLINPETGKYLAEELDLRIVTSTRDLVNRNIIADNILSGNKSAELFGSPKFNLDSNEIQDISQKYAVNKQSFENSNSNNKLSRGLSDTLLRGLGYDELPGTKIEIEKISEILKSQGWTAKTHTGIDATEEAVKSVNNPKILHIATHGQFDKNNETSEEQKKIYENPLLKSKLILAGGENTRIKLMNEESIDSGTEDGYLTAYEVMNMNLDNTELVVLSACETGLGEIRNGEGVYGLQRAFQVAGAKSLIMSLWKVPDAPTQELMLSFYSKWLGGMDKRDAFRQSQMELAKKYSNFYYWGAFEIISNY
jgi:CHAT domain-containing protein